MQGYLLVPAFPCHMREGMRCSAAHLVPPAEEEAHNEGHQHNKYQGSADHRADDNAGDSSGAEAITARRRSNLLLLLLRLLWLRRGFLARITNDLRTNSRSCITIGQVDVHIAQGSELDPRSPIDLRIRKPNRCKRYWNSIDDDLTIDRDGFDHRGSGETPAASGPWSVAHATHRGPGSVEEDAHLGDDKRVVNREDHEVILRRAPEDLPLDGGSYRTGHCVKGSSPSASNRIDLAMIEPVRIGNRAVVGQQNRVGSCEGHGIVGLLNKGGDVDAHATDLA